MKRCLHTGLLVMLAVAWFRPAAANEQVAQITIRVIYTVKQKLRSVDPALKDIEAELLEMPGDKFRLLDKLETRVPMNSTVELQFPGDRSISVRFLGLDVSGEKPMLSLHLKLKPMLNMQLRLANGGRTLLGGPSHLEGTLILDVSAVLVEKAPPPPKPEQEPKPLEVNR
ncbi:MAG: hypothetical protein JXR96_07390 [Deltaproteobacteria bacterium]|nr:hypothetical protein [Deltaproteobacteria bacterium]